MTAAIAGVRETKFGYPETCRTLVKLWRSHFERIMSAVNCCACSLCPSTAVLLSNKCFTWRVFSLTKNPLCPPALMVPQAGLGRTQKKIVSQPPPPASLSLSLSRRRDSFDVSDFVLEAREHSKNGSDLHSRCDYDAGQIDTTLVFFYTIHLFSLKGRLVLVL